MPNPRTATAYQYVAESLRRRILLGQLGPGVRLPSERELCDQFSASRITVRRALQILADELLIQRRQGDGTYVSPAPSRKIPLRTTDFSGSVATHAPDLYRQLESHEWRRAPDAIADNLQTFPGASVLFARRLDLLEPLGDASVAFDELYILEPFAEQLSSEDLGQLRFLERWQEVQQIRLSHLTQIVEASAATAHEAKYLRCKVGAPVLKELDIFFTANNAPCGLFISYYRHELFRLKSTVRLSIASQPYEVD